MIRRIRHWLEYRIAIWQADRALKAARKRRRIQGYRKGWSR